MNTKTKISDVQQIEELDVQGTKKRKQADPK